MSMGTEQSSHRTYDQIHEPVESLQQFSDGCHDQVDTDSEVDMSSQQTNVEPHGFMDTETEVGESSQQAIRRPCDEAGVETEVGELSKRPCFDKRRLLDPRSFSYTQLIDSPYRPTPNSPSSEAIPSSHNHGISASKAARPLSLSFDPKRLLDPKSFLAQWMEHPQLQNPSTSRTNSSCPPKPNTRAPPRPPFDQLITDGQQGMKVLFFVDHATKGDAIHYNLKTIVSKNSSEMKLLMSHYSKDRSRFQYLFFAKARTICAQLTSRHAFLELDGLETSRAGRLAYFSQKCTKAHLLNLYSHIVSAVDVPKILTGQTPNDQAFRKLMKQVFIQTMEDLWCFEFHPSKRGLSAKLEKENKEEVYSHFKILTDRFGGLPAAKGMPIYLEVPLKANFPRYVLFDQASRPCNEEDVYESDELNDDRNEGGDTPHPWILAE